MGVKVTTIGVLFKNAEKPETGIINLDKEPLWDFEPFKKKQLIWDLPIYILWVCNHILV